MNDTLYILYEECERKIRELPLEDENPHYVLADCYEKALKAIADCSKSEVNHRYAAHCFLYLGQVFREKFGG